MRSDELQSRVAVVTGASAGIGRAVALELSRAGAGVVVNARRADRLEALVGEIESAGGRAVATPGDCADDDVVRRMLDAAGELKASIGSVAQHGSESRATYEGSNRQADIVVINAGRGLAGSVFSSDRSQWEEMIRTNVQAAALLLREAGTRMAEDAEKEESLSQGERGARPRDIVVIGSNVGEHISPFSSMYGSTKFAVGSLAEAARRELGPKGVRVTLISPGVVETEFQQVAGYSDDLVRGFHEKFDPLLAPEDVARLIGFVVSQPAHVHVNDAIIRPTRQDYP